MVASKNRQPSSVETRETEPARLSRPWRKRLLVVLAALVLLVMVVELAYLWQSGGFGFFGSRDFVEYWASARLLLAGENPYDPALLQEMEHLGTGQEDLVMMWNPPWTPLAFLPVLLLPLRASTLAWLGLNFILLIASATLFWTVQAPEAERRRLWIAWAAALVFMPALFTLRAGQISILLLVCVVGFFYFAERRHDVAAGAFLTLASIKLHVLYLFLIAVAWWVLRERRWRVVLGAGVTMAVWVGVLLLFAPHSLADYIQAMAQNPPTNWNTATLGGVLRSLLGPEHTWLQFLPTVVVGLAAGLFFLWRRPALSWPRDLAPILLLSVPTGAYGWSFDQTVLLPVSLALLGWAAARWKEARGPALLVLLGLALIQAVLAWQNQAWVNDAYLAWTPLALGLLYLYGARTLAPAAAHEEET